MRLGTSEITNARIALDVSKILPLYQNGYTKLRLVANKKEKYEILESLI